MRIAIPIHAFEPGGVERVALRLAQRWRDEGHEVIVVLGRDRGACRDEAPALDYRSWREPVPTDRWETIWMMFTLLRFLLREEVDVIFCPGLTYTAACVVAKLCLGERCPPVVVKVSNDLERPDLGGLMAAPYRLWLWLQGKLLEHFVAIGKPMREPTARALGIAPSAVAVIPDPAISSDQLRALSDHTGDASDRASGRHFLAIGRLVPQKNFALLIDAFARIATPQDRLTIAGEGPCRAQLEQQLHASGLAAQVALPGHITAIAPLLHSADAMVISSDYEGVPAVIVEALAAGLPLAATDCCASMLWLLGDGAFGELAPRGDAGALGLAMAQICQRRVPHSAMHAMAGEFTLERSVGLYLTLLKRAAQAHSHSNRKKIRAGGAGS